MAEEPVYPTNPYARVFDKMMGGAPGPTGVPRMAPPDVQRKEEYENQWGGGEGDLQGSPPDDRQGDDVVSPPLPPAPLSSFLYIDIQNNMVWGDNGESFPIPEEKLPNGVTIQQHLLMLCRDIAVAEYNRRVSDLTKKLGLPEPQLPEGMDEETEVPEVQNTKAPPAVQPRKKRKRKTVPKASL